MNSKHQAIRQSLGGSAYMAAVLVQTKNMCVQNLELTDTASAGGYKWRGRQVLYGRARTLESPAMFTRIKIRRFPPLQGYLAHKKQPLSRTPQWDYA